MLSSHNFSEATIECIKAFVTGDLSMADFMVQYQECGEIACFLEWVVDSIAMNHIPIRHRTVVEKNYNQNKPYEQVSYVRLFIKEYAQTFRDLSEQWKECPPRVGPYLLSLSPATAAEAYKIHAIVADIYYQIDPALSRTEKYLEEFNFSLDILPGYLAGGLSAENYVSQYIMPKYPASMKKGERKRLVKEEIRQAFQRDCKGFPRWIQMPEWPIGANNKPMVYLGQKAFEHHSEYYFRDAETNEKHTVTQWW